MLSEKERSKIRLEEAYRQEYLRASEPRSNKFLGFLNSNFGLFVLSTIFISAFSWGYSQLSEWRRENANRAATEQHLRLEIAQRLRVIRKLGTRFPYSDLNIIRTATYGYRVGSVQVPSHMLIYSPIFEEYGPRSLESLLWELESMVAEPEKSQIRLIRSKSFDISQCFDKLVETTEEKSSKSAQEKVEPKDKVRETSSDKDKIYYYELSPPDKLVFQNQIASTFASLDNGGS